MYNEITEEHKVTKLIIYPSKKACQVEVLGVTVLFTLFLLLTYVALSHFAFPHIMITTRIIFIGSLLLGEALFYLIIKSSFSARCKCRHYEITQDQVITYDGIVSCKQSISNLKGLTGMEMSESATGKFLHYGTITLKFMGGGTAIISDIDEPEDYLPKITEIISKGYITL